MIGYKGFNKDLTCRGFQYEIGKEYEHTGKIELCKGGFHFCQNIADILSFYDIQSDECRLCLVEATGEIEVGEDKCVTNKIKILKEISKAEMYEVGNEGKNNVGLGNTGDWNTGNRNTGDSNTGDWNTGDWNTGDRNTGDWNTGNRNTGDRNTGDWNKTNRSSGAFCTEEPKMIMFNKETDMTFKEWRNTRAYDLLSDIKKSEWVYYEDMTKKEIKENKSAKTCGGYLKEISRKEAVKEWWQDLSVEDKQEIFNLPNFDLKIFNEIMEYRITKKEYSEVTSYGKK